MSCIITIHLQNGYFSKHLLYFTIHHSLPTHGCCKCIPWQCWHESDPEWVNCSPKGVAFVFINLFSLGRGKTMKPFLSFPHEYHHVFSMLIIVITGWIQSPCGSQWAGNAGKSDVWVAGETFSSVLKKKKLPLERKCEATRNLCNSQTWKIKFHNFFFILTSATSFQSFMAAPCAFLFPSNAVFDKFLTNSFAKVYNAISMVCVLRCAQKLREFSFSWVPFWGERGCGRDLGWMRWQISGWDIPGGGGVCVWWLFVI